MDLELPADSDPASCTASSSDHDVSGIKSDDIATFPSALSDHQKLQILTSKPKQLKVYPSNSQQRRFQYKWVNDFHWIRYSVSTDGVFCAPCFVFNKSHFTEFISSPFRDWKNAVGSLRGALNRHALSENHQACMEKSVSFIAVMEKKQKSIKSQLSASYDKQVQQNTKALTAIIDTICF